MPSPEFISKFKQLSASWKFPVWVRRRLNILIAKYTLLDINYLLFISSL
jgi:hypothetical protein